TANAMAGDADKCFSAGMDDYLAKPFEIDDLSDKLNKWLSAAVAAEVEVEADAEAEAEADAEADAAVSH
ncbi:MAG: hypothetical protein WBN51_06510, partial [Gammaproteobacteria bacterium]